MPFFYYKVFDIDEIKRRCGALKIRPKLKTTRCSFINRMEMRRRAQPTTSWERARFVLLWRCGMSLRAIARHTGSSVTTVYRWIRRWQQEGHIKTRNRLCKSLQSDLQKYIPSTKDVDYGNPMTFDPNSNVDNGVVKTCLDTRKAFPSPLYYDSIHTLFKHFPFHLEPKNPDLITMFITVYPYEWRLHPTT